MKHGFAGTKDLKACCMSHKCLNELETTFYRVSINAILLKIKASHGDRCQSKPYIIPLFIQEVVDVTSYDTSVRFLVQWFSIGGCSEDRLQRPYSEKI